MLRTTRLRQLFSVFLLTAVLLVTTAIGNIGSQAFAATGASNEISNVKGEGGDINRSYHKLQEATQNSRNQIEEKRKASSGSKSARQVAQPREAIENLNKSTKNAFQRTAESIKEGLNSNEDAL